jgi:hypothetical protein
LADSAIAALGDPLAGVGRSVAKVVRVSLHLPSLPKSVRLVVVKLIPSSDVTVRPHRWRRTVTRTSPAAAHDGEPLPLQPKPSYLHESKRRVTGNAWVGSVSWASSPPTSLSSLEHAVRRAPASLSLTAGPAWQTHAHGQEAFAGHATRAGPRWWVSRPSVFLIFGKIQFLIFFTD